MVSGFNTDLNTISTGNILYRETTDSSILAQLKSYIVAYNSSTSSLSLRSAFIVTYDNVPFFASPSSYNSFQIIITTSASCETFALVIYKFLYPGRGTYSAGFTAGNGILYKNLANADLVYLSNNPSSTLPSYVVYKLSNDNYTCGKKLIFFLCIYFLIILFIVFKSTNNKIL